MSWKQTEWEWFIATELDDGSGLIIDYLKHPDPTSPLPWSWGICTSDEEISRFGSLPPVTRDEVTVLVEHLEGCDFATALAALEATATWNAPIKDLVPTLRKLYGLGPVQPRLVRKEPHTSWMKWRGEPLT